MNENLPFETDDPRQTDLTEQLSLRASIIASGLLTHRVWANEQAAPIAEEALNIAVEIYLQAAVRVKQGVEALHST